MNRLRADYANGPYYWLLITSGFRTYRLLSTFWQRFTPRHDTQTSPHQKRLLDALAAERFGDRRMVFGAAAAAAAASRKE